MMTGPTPCYPNCRSGGSMVTPGMVRAGWQRRQTRQITANAAAVARPSCIPTEKPASRPTNTPNRAIARAPPTCRNVLDTALATPACPSDACSRTTPATGGIATEPELAGQKHTAEPRVGRSCRCTPRRMLPRQRGRGVWPTRMGARPGASLGRQSKSAHRLLIQRVSWDASCNRCAFFDWDDGGRAAPLGPRRRGRL